MGVRVKRGSRIVLGCKVDKMGKGNEKKSPVLATGRKSEMATSALPPQGSNLGVMAAYPLPSQRSPVLVTGKDQKGPKFWQDS